VQTGDRAKVLATYVDAYKNAQLTVAANESARTGKPVELGD
jgi:hypothetical protein